MHAAFARSWVLYPANACGYMVRLPCWPPRGLQVSHQRSNRKEPCHIGEKACKQVTHPGFETQGSTSPEVQNGYQWPNRKGLCNSQKNLNKKVLPHERKRHTDQPLNSQSGWGCGQTDGWMDRHV